MDRKGYFLKPGVRSTAPGVLFTVVADSVSKPNTDATATEWHEWNGADVYVAHRRNGVWQSFASARCNSPLSLRLWMHKHASKERRNYVFVPQAGEALSLTQFWTFTSPQKVKYAPCHEGAERVKQGSVPPWVMLVRKLVLSHRTTILAYRQGGYQWTWLGARQFFDASEESLAESMGFEWFETGELRHQQPNVKPTSSERAALWLKVFMRLIDWWKVHTKAPFGVSAASLAMGVLRTHIGKGELCHHRHPVAWRLERDACFGGRASVWYYGDVGMPWFHSSRANPAPPRSRYGCLPGPAVLLDVKSMYPWLLREREYPVQIRTCSEKCHRDDAQGYADSFPVVADVTIETEVPEYPQRVGDRIYYRRGRFRTVLTSPELRQLRSDGRVLQTHAMAVYSAGRPFQAAAGALIDHREGLEGGTQGAWELFAKTLANGLGGKLAQKKGVWEHCPKVCPPYPWGEWLVASSSGRRPTRFRAICGMVFKWKPDDSGEGPYTACFAFLAAYGRLHMRGIRSVIPRERVIAQDTDGIWACLDGVDSGRCCRVQTKSNAGDCREKRRTEAARFFDAKHYYTAEGWTLAGFSNPRIDDTAEFIQDEQRHAGLVGRGGDAPVGVTVVHRKCSLRIKSHGMRIGKDGWATETTTS